MNCLKNVFQGDTIKSSIFIPFLPRPSSHLVQFVRRRFGKPLGFSSTGSQIPRNTELGFTPASIRTSAWTTSRRTSAAPRSTRTWWPEWVHKGSCSVVNPQQLTVCFWPAESIWRRRPRRVGAEDLKWCHLFYRPLAKLGLSPAFQVCYLRARKRMWVNWNTNSTLWPWLWWANVTVLSQATGCQQSFRPTLLK